PGNERSIEQRAQPVDRLADLPRVAREAQPDKPFAHRPEGAARRESDLDMAQRLFGKGEAVAHPGNAEEGVERALRPRHFDSAAGIEPVDREVTGGAAARDKLLDEGFAVTDRGDAGMLQEGR